MLLARQTGARATLFTAANFTLREGRRKVNEGSYLLACKGGLASQTVAPRNCSWPIVLELQAAVQFQKAYNAQSHSLHMSLTSSSIEQSL
jgi:hypothetical protein